MDDAADGTNSTEFYDTSAGQTEVDLPARADGYPETQWLERDAHFDVAVGLLILYVLHWAIYRFTDGIRPSERKLAREQRERAQRYMDSKKSERDSLLRCDGDQAP